MSSPCLSSTLMYTSNGDSPVVACRYNVINNWDYVGVAKAFDNGAGHVIASRVGQSLSFGALHMLILK